MLLYQSLRTLIRAKDKTRISSDIEIGLKNIYLFITFNLFTGCFIPTKQTYIREEDPYINLFLRVQGSSQANSNLTYVSSGKRFLYLTHSKMERERERDRKTGREVERGNHER